MTTHEKITYLDYAATTPIDARVLERMWEVQKNNFANPASNHAAGRHSAALVQTAAEQLGKLLNAAPEAIVWTSGATESNNLAIVGAAKQRSHRGKHLVTMRTEHKAVVDVFRALEKQGFDVTWLLPDRDGRLPVARLAEALRDDTQLVSIMHVNNETGTEQDIYAIGRLCRERGVWFHVDAAQSVGKVDLDLTQIPIDLLSLTAHKFYGPKGIGALYIAADITIEPLMFGGGHQRRLRPGTLAVDLIVGLGEAARIAAKEMADERQKVAALRDCLWQGLHDIDGIYVNGDEQSAYAGILNVGIADIEGESLLLALEPLCVATGSACNSQSKEPSYVLRAFGLDDAEAQSAIRFSFGRQTTAAEIETAVTVYRKAVAKLRQLAPEQIAR